MADYTNGYAIALFALAKEEKKLEKYKEDALTLVEALNESPSYIHLLNSKIISREDRITMAKKAFGQVEESLQNFIFILIEKSKVNIIITVLKKLISFLNQELDVDEGVVYSAEELSSSQIEQITKKVSKSLGLHHLSLVNKIDVDLISGFRVEVRDEVIEDSVTSRMEIIKQQLLGKGI